MIFFIVSNSYGIADAYTLNSELPNLLKNVKSNAAKIDNATIHARQKTTYILGKTTKVEDLQYKSRSGHQLLRIGDPSINQNMKAIGGEGILCITPTYGFHIQRASGNTEYIFNRSLINTENDDTHSLFRQEFESHAALIYAPIHIASLRLDWLIDKSLIIFEDCVYLDTLHKNLRFKVKIDYEIARPSAPNGSIAIHMRGHISVDASNGYSVYEYSIAHTEGFNMSITGKTEYTKQDNIINPSTTTMTISQNGMDVLRQDLDFNSFVLDVRNSYELFKLSYYRLPDIQGVAYAKDSLFENIPSYLLYLSIAAIALLLSLIVGFVIRKRAKAKAAQVPPPPSTSAS